jgi:hypothetical protein
MVTFSASSDRVCFNFREIDLMGLDSRSKGAGCCLTHVFHADLHLLIHIRSAVNSFFTF